MNTIRSKIANVLSQLSDIVEMKSDVLILVDNGDLHESVVMATQAGYVHAAVAVLKIALASDESVSDVEVELTEIEGIEYKIVHEVIQDAVGKSGDVWPVCGYVAGSDDELQKLRDYFRQLD